MKTALEILNQVEPNGELLDTDTAITAMELYAKVNLFDELQRYEIFKAVNDYNDCDLTHEEIIYKYLN